MGHLIAAPLIPLKSHQAVADGRSSSYSGPRPSQTASKQPAALRNTPMFPNMSPKRGPTGEKKQLMAAALPCQLLTCLQECLVGRCPGAGTLLLVHTLNKVQTRRYRCSSLSLQARPGWELCSGGPTRSPTPLYRQLTPPPAHMGRGLMAAIYEVAEPRIPPAPPPAPSRVFIDL